jgi:hypothetical protein
VDAADFRDTAEELALTPLVPGVDVASGWVFDTHNERDHWDELKYVSALCTRRKHKARFVGIPTGGALVIHPDGKMESVGEAPFVMGN